MWLMLGLVALLISLIVGAVMRTSAHWVADHGIFMTTRILSALTTQKESATWKLGLAAKRRPEFQLKVQGQLDAFFHRIGISDEVQTGDSRFDRTFYVASDHPDLRQQLKSSAALREALLKLRDGIVKSGWQFRQIRLGGERLWVEAAGRKNQAPPALTLQVPHLLEVLERLPELPSVGQRDPYHFRAALVLALSSALAIGGGVALFGLISHEPPQLFDRWPSLLLSWWLGPLLALVLAAMALAWLGRSARSHFVLVELLTVGLFGCWSLTLTGARHWNRVHDSSAAQLIQARVEGHSTTRSFGKRRRTLYWVQFAAVPGFKLPAFEQQVSMSEYNAFRDGSCVSFLWHPGRFGWAWYEARRTAVEEEAALGCPPVNP